jgi:ribokinase
MSNIDIVGFGALNMDHLYEVDRTVSDGEQLVTGYTSAPSGSAANTIYGLAKLGINTGFIGAVGSDPDGNKLIEDFKAVGVDTSRIRIKKRAITGLAMCLTDKLGNRAIYVSPGANNLLNIKDVNLSYVKKAKIVHLSSFAGSKQFDCQIKLVKELGSSVKICFAPGMFYAAKGLEVLAPILSRSSVVFTNLEEMERLTDKDFMAGARECLAIGCDTIVITLGGGLTMGNANIICYICNKEDEYKVKQIENTPIPKLDTTGAGDAFAAGFIFGLIKSKTIKECRVLGEIMARFTISDIGARKGLPFLNQVSQAFYECLGQKL